MAHGRTHRPTVLSIAGSDSGGGAGIQADLRTFAAHGVHGATVLVAATAQNTRRVAAAEPLSTRLVRRQIDAVFSDLRPRAVKIGMLFDAPRIRAVASGLRRWKAPNVVLDPVMIAKSGARLLSRRAVVELRSRLFPLAELVTPNIPEAEALSGIRIRSESDRRLAAGILADFGARAVLIKGGHGGGRQVRDLLFDGAFFTVFAAPRLRTRATHGTGCTLSSAIAANLALGLALPDAVERAVVYLRAAIARGYFPGTGYGVPDHLAPRVRRIVPRRRPGRARRR
jgi:hydroxymethylpyrimidine/phosphomethylpyrimidine kinase